MIMNQGGMEVSREPVEPEQNRESMKLLRERLQLELAAAEKYLELANNASDEHTKLLLRLISFGQHKTR